ncbi:hypothetical protein J6590_005245 [Homalodisca vitripennis]|nr:hypothetical protein J6590_005245 [Homalodisca vitripennis]
MMERSTQSSDRQRWIAVKFGLQLNQWEREPSAIALKAGSGTSGLIKSNYRIGELREDKIRAPSRLGRKTSSFCLCAV